MAHLDSRAAACGYTTYSEEHVTYPPKGLLPLPNKSVEPIEGCDLWGQIFDAALLINPAFDIYRVFDTVSVLVSVPHSPNKTNLIVLVSDPMGRTRIPVSLPKSLTLPHRNSRTTSYSGSFPQVQVSPIYFDREDVKRAIHAPLNVTWTECSNIDVFPRGDGSPPPAFSVLPNVIEKSERAVIVHGLADFILIAEGTRIVLQNMTCE